MSNIILILLGGEAGYHEYFYLNKEGTGLTDSPESAMIFPHVQTAERYFKNFVRPAVLMGHSDFELLDSVFVLEYNLRERKITKL